MKFSALITGLSALALWVGLTGCAADRSNQSASYERIDDPAAQRSLDEATNQLIEDSRTAERAREALAAGADYRYEGVKVAASNGVVQLNGFVDTITHRATAAMLTRRVTGVKRIENNLAVRD